MSILWSVVRSLLAIVLALVSLAAFAWSGVLLGAVALSPVVGDPLVVSLTDVVLVGVAVAASVFLANFSLKLSVVLTPGDNSGG